MRTKFEKVFCAIVACFGFAQLGLTLPKAQAFAARSMGNLSTVVPEGAAASLPILWRYFPGSQSGTVVSNVNLLTGQPAYSVPLDGINGNGGVQFPITIGYGGSVREDFYGSSANRPTGPVGFGWSMAVPFVATNHKGTVTLEDDVIFCSLGGYGGGQILKAKDGTFLLTSDYTIIISTTTLNGFISSWKFKFPNGIEMTMGSPTSDVDAKRYLNVFGDQITGHPAKTYVTGNTFKKFPYRWDLWRINDNNSP